MMIPLESAGYSVTDRNVIPSCSKLISAFCIFMWGFGSDLTGSRFWFVFGPLVRIPVISRDYTDATIQAYGLLPNGILAFWPASKELKLFAFMTGVNQISVSCILTASNFVVMS